MMAKGENAPRRFSPVTPRSIPSPFSRIASGSVVLAASLLLVLVLAVGAQAQDAPPTAPAGAPPPTPPATQPASPSAAPATPPANGGEPTAQAAPASALEQSTTPSTVLDKPAIEARIAALESMSEKDAGAQSELTLLKETLKFLADAEGSAARNAEWQERKRNASKNVDSARAELAAIAPVAKPDVGASKEQLETALKSAEAELAAARDQRDRIERDTQDRAARRKEPSMPSSRTRRKNFPLLAYSREAVASRTNASVMSSRWLIA